MRALLPHIVQEIDPLRQGGCSRARPAYQYAKCHTAGRSSLHRRLHLSRGFGRTCSRCGHHNGKQHPHSRRRQGRHVAARAADCRPGIHAGGFRLRARTVLHARRYSRCLLFCREPPIPYRLLRRHGRLDTSVQHIEPALKRQGPTGRDHPEPQLNVTREGVAGALCRRGDILVLRRRLHPAPRERPATPPALRNGGARTDRLPDDQPQHPARGYAHVPSV